MKIKGKSFFVVLGVVAFFSSCAEESNSSQEETDKQSNEPEDVSDVVIQDTLDQQEEPLPFAWFMNTPEASVSVYIQTRKQVVSVSEDVHITGSVFYEGDSFYILNFMEKWGDYEYPFALVVGSTHVFESGFSNERSIYDDIGTFIAERAPGQYMLFNGNFKDFEYKQGTKKGIILENKTWFNNEVNGSEQLFFVDGSRLEPTELMAYTSGFVGDCERINGFSEEFKYNVNDQSEVFIVREENEYDNVCDLVYHTSYKKMWDDTEQMLNEPFPRYFFMPYAESSAYYNTPKELFYLYLEGEDTLTDLENIKFVEHTRGGIPIFASVWHNTIWDGYG